ncbi:MAG: YifB family Mg chelatase-like AAA ATPase [Sporichthyaceae bacterium]
MTGRGWGVALTGVQGRVVSVEADIGSGLPKFALIGLPDTALSEARERVKAAVSNSGRQWPEVKVTVSLSPADLHKRGSGFDLALALVVLAATKQVPAEDVARLVMIGELGLDGRVRSLRGVLPAVAAAAREGFGRILVPEANVEEAQLVDGVEIVGIRSLRHACAWLRGEPIPDEPEESAGRQAEYAPAAAPQWRPDLADVRGQHEARRALEVAAVGGHHVFMHGGPGVGKTMLAERLPGLLPALSQQEALEVTEIHSVAGYLRHGVPLVTHAPFFRPHHSATAAAIIGGGGAKEIRPGAVSLAHRGTLFIDEATEYRGGVLDGLRQPMEFGEVVIARSGLTVRFPAEFLLVMAANPCPCSSSDPRQCTCKSDTRRRYLARLSRPLLDRVDLQVMVDRPSRHHLMAAQDGEDTATVAARVAQARDRSARRLAGTPWTRNAQVPSPWLRTAWRIDAAALRTVETALDRGTLSPRGMDRILRVAWSMADLAGIDRPGRAEVGEALALRSGIAGGWAA